MSLYSVKLHLMWNLLVEIPNWINKKKLIIYYHERTLTWKEISPRSAQDSRTATAFKIWLCTCNLLRLCCEMHLDSLNNDVRKNSTSQHHRHSNALGFILNHPLAQAQDAIIVNATAWCALLLQVCQLLTAIYVLLLLRAMCFSTLFVTVKSAYHNSNDTSW